MPKPYNLLEEFARFGVERKISLRDPDAASAFTKHVGDAMQKALADPILIHGQRVEAMFEAMLVSLGRCRFVKAEDSGRLFATEPLRVPDFRVVIEDGEQWLIEVKNVFEEDPFRQVRRIMSNDYHRQLDAYAKLTGGKLKVAIYWARWSLWTLISPERFLDANGNLTLDMQTALKFSELGWLGDRSIGTTPPLKIRLNADPAKTGPIGPDGEVNVTIGSGQVFCGNVEIVDPTEREIVWIFMQYGQWQESGPHPIIDGTRLDALEFIWEPLERANEGFEMIGSLSHIFARHYAQHTIKDKEVIQLRAPVQPGWLAPLVSPRREKHTLPLWTFQLTPDFDKLDDATVAASVGEAAVTTANEVGRCGAELEEADPSLS